MGQEVQVEEGISLVALFKLLLSKLKFLILAAVIGGILGGAFAVWKTIDINHYGTKVEFYVNPERERDATQDSEYSVYGTYSKPVMDSIVRLLDSESFAEQMILNGSALPEKDVWVNEGNQAEVDLGLNEKIDVAADKLEKVATERAKLNELIASRALQQEAYDEAYAALNREWSRFVYEGKVKTTTFNEVEYELLVARNEAGTELPRLFAAMQQAKDILETETEGVDAQKLVVEDKLATAEVEKEKALGAWRQTAKYKSHLARYSSALSFSYLSSNLTAQESNDVARSFIYVNVFVLNDKAFAEEVLKRVKTVVPAYVEARITIPDGYTSTNCERITRTDDIRLTNPGYTTMQAIKYAALVGFAACVLVAAIIIIVDKADNRLRDTSFITKHLNVPILGFIPSIEDMGERALEGKKKEKEAQ